MVRIANHLWTVATICLMDKDYQNWQSEEDEEERVDKIFGKMPSQEEINQMLETRDCGLSKTEE
jgi:hypothetical protein